ncbi:hypothetical protein L218DRAFT_888916 [Marasmius fiardii PR-910]|nr:hypothetical protein L218DRAFT_888916 [Marasmius fiardii PR-910]
MHQVISRPQPISSSVPPPVSRPPRKSASFRSLRREKEKHSLSSPSDTHQSSHHDSPSELPYARPTYFDAYPEANKAGPSRSTRSSRTREQASSNSSPTTEEHYGSKSSPVTDQGTSYSSESSRPSPVDTDLETSPVTPKPSNSYRPRSRTNPSSKHTHWLDQSADRRPLTSSSQFIETQQDNPSDSSSINLFPVEVAAPISGVEMMDALVEGMNGGRDDFSNGGRSGTSPLYQPPLPTPPPGVVLGGTKIRKSKRLTSRSHKRSNDSGDEDHGVKLKVPTTPRQKRPKQLGSSRSGSTVTITPSSSSPITPQSSDSHIPIESDTPSSLDFPKISSSIIPVTSAEKRASSALSISDIIRAYATPDTNVRTRPPLSRNSSFSRSTAHETVHEEPEPDLGTAPIPEEGDLASRSSYDSIADEVQRTLRNQINMNPTPPPPPPSSYPKRHSIMSDSSLTSPRSDGGGASIYSSSITSSQPPLSPFESTHLVNSLKPTHEIAQYLRSTRLTTLLKLTRSPHASHDNPLTVSLSDLGSSTGHPVVVFLGLGCVRHIMGLYDEMAECMGLRLITIDRWGLGRTEPRAKSAKGIMQWASVIEEVLDMLHIDECSVMAHSAGSPYALSFASKLRKRIRGDICLLAPWVGGSESGGYKWLKYVPNGILKTAQAAEWKLQTWMIGKPPTIAWEGIGYDAKKSDGNPRPSMGSNFSEYDDLRDFDGRFESRSTLGVSPSRSGNERSSSEGKVAVRKTSKGFLGRLKGNSVSQPPSPQEISHPSGKRLKGLRSMGSLKSKPSSKKPLPQLPLPPTLNGFEVGLGLEDLKFTPSDAKSIDQQSNSSSSTRYAKGGSHSPYSFNTHGGRRRSISFTSTTSRPPVPSLSPPNLRSPDLGSETHDTPSLKNGHQTSLGNALIAASHSESAKGTHNDLLQILNHENHSWGFSYQSYPHNVCVWYGDKDEKIAENAVRWMEKTMGDGKCTVKVVKGADHGLMYNSSVVVEVLECLLQYWQGNDRR